MGIGFEFSTSPCVWADIATRLERLSEELGAWCNTGENATWVGLCREGEIAFRYEQGCIAGDCQTNVAGAGFHAAALDFLELLAQESGLALKVEDETGYYRHQDFQRLRAEHFYAWLGSLLKVAERQLENGAYKSLVVCRKIGQYLPEDMPGTIVTPMGRFRISTILRQVEEEGIESFAREFFQWNERERDARYFRNAALSMLWEDCYFMPSQRSNEDAATNHRILGLLEYAMELDSTLPLPKAEYQLLCRLDAHEPVNMEQIPELQSEFPVGFRRGPVSVRLGNLTFTVPGSYLYVAENGGRDNVYYDAMEENWHSVRISAFGVKTGRTSFSTDLFAPFAGETEDFPVGEGLCRAAFAGQVTDEDGDTYYQMIAEILSGTQVTLLTLSFQQEQEQRWAMELLKGMKAVLPKKAE